MRHLIARRRRPAASRGLSLVELMVTVTVAGLLAMAASPHLADYMNNSRLREGGNVLQAEALFAQSEAIKRNRVVRMTTSGSTIQVLEAQDAAATTLLRERTLAGGVTAAAATVDFSPRGYLVDRSVAPSVEFVAAAIDLSMPGVTCSSDQRCPGLRVDGGGGIRLCGNKLSGC
ncbi:MAG: GspH/FimT family pseudopilin [Rubrivivax sp.]|nr:GspH/FimT family pseudopilin [Rubrivivax sp.]